MNSQRSIQDLLTNAPDGEEAVAVTDHPVVVQPTFHALCSLLNMHVQPQRKASLFSQRLEEVDGFEGGPHVVELSDAVFQGVGTGQLHLAAELGLDLGRRS